MHTTWKKANYLLAFAICMLGFISVYLAFSQSPPSSTEKQAEEITHSKIFDSWSFECRKSCIIIQKVMNDAGDPLLTAQIFMIKRGEQGLPRLRIIAPLGTFLPAGITVDLSVHDPFTVPFQFCTDQGCFINLDLASDVVDALRNEKTLSVSYRKENRETQTVEISLSGLSKALEHFSQK